MYLAHTRKEVLFIGSMTTRQACFAKQSLPTNSSFQCWNLRGVLTANYKSLKASGQCVREIYFVQQSTYVTAHTAQTSQ